jgi:hypothetical protein
MQRLSWLSSRLRDFCRIGCSTEMTLFDLAVGSGRTRARTGETMEGIFYGKRHDEASSAGSGLVCAGPVLEELLSAEGSENRTGMVS